MKLGGWLVMITAFIVFLSLLGIQTGLTSILTDVGIIADPQAQQFTADFENSSFWNNIDTLILAIVVGGSVIIGFFARGYDVSLIYAPFIAVVGYLYLSTFISVIKYTGTFNQFWLTSIVGLVFSALGIGFIMACVDYFGGR